MNRKAVAKELVGMAKELTAGQRVNMVHLELEGEANIGLVLRDLTDALREIRGWQKAGAKVVAGFGKEWIPYY